MHLIVGPVMSLPLSIPPSQVMELKHCEVFSYVPDMEEDPFSDGVL